MSNDKIEELFGWMPNTVEVKSFSHERGTGLLFSWVRKGIGFGELALLCRPDGTFYVDTEYMSSEFCAEVIKQAIEEAVKEEDNE